MLATPGTVTPPNSVQTVSAATGSSNSPPPVATSCSSSLSPAAAISCHINNNNVQSVKCDPHLTPSPTGGVLSTESSNSQRLIDDGTIKNTSNPDTSSLQRENSVMQRKNSNSSITSVVNSNGSGTLLHTSPTSTNNNDNSNSSNSAISQIMDSDPLGSNIPELVSSVNKTNNVDDCNEKVNLNPSAAGNFANTCSSKEISSSCTSSSSSSSSSSGKDDTEIHGVLGNLTNVKKEQRSVGTPEISPEGFNALPSLNGNNANTVAADESPGTNNSSIGKSANIIGTTSGISSAGGSSCISSLLQHDSSSGGLQSNNNFNGNVSIISNSMDYMQQQNHIFVFSTQLANKGAESVLNGQFPTIIAYHCTQPATKKFLEDFFLKNPMKMAKIQRQNSLNMGASVSTGHQWVTSANCLAAKSHQKITAVNGRNNVGASATSNNQICNNTCIEDKVTTTTISGSLNAGFRDPTDSLSNESELMNWEQPNIGLQNISSANTGHSIKIGEAVENISGSPHNIATGASSLTQQSPNKASMGNSTTPVSPGDNMQPSLQGVKVPDENLTPQQRQHREEQLAKLKKMNQFLFPEHGGELLPDSATLQGSNQLGKINSDIIIANSSGSGGLVGILSDSSPTTVGIGLGSLPPNLRGPNNIGMGRGSGSIRRNHPGALGSGPPDEGSMQVGIIGGPGDINNLHCGNQSTVTNTLLMNAQQGLSCGSGSILSPIGPNTHVANMTGNHSHSQGTIMSHSTLVSGGINSVSNCAPPIGALMLPSGHPKGMSGAHQIDVGGGTNTQVEWSKMQHQFYEERVRNNKGVPDLMAGISGLCRSISSAGNSYVRPSHPGSGISGPALNATGAVGRSQGPPPPYHPTQRSASVPIATQSPNPSSPNNPTSNLSLPSPRTASGSCSTTLNSPSSDVLVPASSATPSNTTGATVATISAASSNPPNQCKTFQQEDSPTGSNNNMNNGNNGLRNNLNQFNSNPSTPLSNMSPKDLESLNSTAIGGDVKNARPSPQRSRTPHVGSNSNSESTNLEGRFPSASPGANFPSHIQNQSGVSKLSSNSLENITSGQAPFGRRPDNLPLNPNSSRPPPIKQSHHHFDPISSLAQMSQQLTSCVSSNGGIGGPSSVGIASALPTEMSIGETAHQNIDGIMGPSGAIDGGMDHCANLSGSSSGMSLPPHMISGGGQYGASGCHIGGPIINPMGSRLLAPKISVGFGAGPNVMRDGPPGFHGGMPPHRMMGRMGVNFCPFSGSPNIQVKASTPNTIQYMPARPQTTNTNPRVPPSLEFLQRFANPQLSGPNINDGSMVTSGPIGISDSNKVPNSSGNSNMQSSGMNFFQNCNQLGSGSGLGNINSGSQGDMVGGMMSSHSDMGGVINIGNPSNAMNIRGVRPVRQGSMGPGGSPVGSIHRMQAPGSHLGGQSGMNQFSNNPHEVIECVGSDPNGIFGNCPNQIFGQQKNSSMGGQSLCQNMPSTSVINGSVGVNEQTSSIQGQINGPGMLGPNNNGPSASGSGPVPGPIAAPSNNVPGNYKSYMGQSANDLKYAQQYHNFQQQLYATSTRSHVSQQMSGSPMGMSVGGINSGIPTNSNPGFFVSK